MSPIQADARLRQTGSGCESQGQAEAAEGLCAQLGGIGVYFQTLQVMTNSEGAVIVITLNFPGTELPAPHCLCMS